MGVGDGRALAAAHPKDDSGGATDATVAAAAAVAVPAAAAAATSCRRETALRGSSICVRSPLWCVTGAAFGCVSCLSLV